VIRCEPAADGADLARDQSLHGIDATAAHSARTYDYLLGGKNNFAADREVVKRALRVFPAARTTARENRKFLGRAVRYVAAEAGVQQFLDIGTGLPTVNNTHEVAQAIEPSSRVVYVDNDPLVLAHARALLTSGPQGRTAFIEADLREPEMILADRITREVLDFSQPIALMLVSILHFIEDRDDPGGIVDILKRALPSGSHLVLTHLTADYDRAGMIAMSHIARQAGTVFVPRTHDEFAAFLTGLDLVDPGIVPVADWRPDSEDAPRPSAAEGGFYAAVARKP
jgi:hypothetical protein